MKLTLKCAAATVILFLCSPAPVVAGPFEDAAAAYNKGDYATALRLLRPLAHQGDAAARYNLGLMYAAGQGVPQDYAEAVKWYRLAANQGYAYAQYNLGLVYGEGKDEPIPQNETEAIKWYRLAANQGQARAQNNLAVMYHYGRACRKAMLKH